MGNGQVVNVEGDADKSNIIAGGSGNQQHISHHYYNTVYGIIAAVIGVVAGAFLLSDGGDVTQQGDNSII
ncbi:hypothetical protein, partial [Candidatus Albibeggiatoa sp. nov. BB20]|uniref:hypothetical protein n=1 Tax=Candidatus Albibeggiatoa sp. nov. BB20 TaxID=3162723 RepID=UPI003365ABBA